MGYDKAVDSAKLDADILSIAEAIRTKGGTDAPLNFPAEFVSAIQAIQAGGSDWPELVSTQEFTLAEDWENDSLGNTQHFYDVYQKPYPLQPSQLELIRIRGNTPGKNPNYIATTAIRNVNTGINDPQYSRSPKYAWRVRSTGASFWIRPGAKITRYVFDFGEVK